MLRWFISLPPFSPWPCRLQSEKMEAEIYSFQRCILLESSLLYWNQNSIKIEIKLILFYYKWWSCLEFQIFPLAYIILVLFGIISTIFKGFKLCLYVAFTLLKLLYITNWNKMVLFALSFIMIFRLTLTYFNFSVPWVSEWASGLMNILCPESRNELPAYDNHHLYWNHLTLQHFHDMVLGGLVLDCRFGFCLCMRSIRPN